MAESNTDRLTWTGQESKLNELEKKIVQKWWKRMEQGYFRYGLDETRVVMIGDMVGNLNPKRASKRVCHDPEKESIPIPVSKPFKPQGFHFMKVKPEEVMFVFTGTEMREFEGFDNFSDDEHLVMINVNPVGSGHSLLVPYPKQHHRQFMIPECLKVGLSWLELMGPNQRLMFNSIGGFGSVNHFHFQLYFTHEIERVENLPLIPTDISAISVFTSWVEGFCIQLSTPEEGARYIMPLIKTMQESNIPHNMFMTQGKAYLYPRLNELSNFDQREIGIASMELSGHMILKTEDHLKLTEEDFEKLILAQMLGRSTLNKIFEGAFPSKLIKYPE